MLLMFPGQGSQKIGMGKDLYDAFPSAREVFQEVDAAISFKLSDLIFNGTEDDLKLTENAQPALMAVSVAFVRVLHKEFNLDILEKADFLAGHSLGEYTALCVDHVISLSDAAKILRVRGAAMAKACPTDGAMAAIMGLDLESVEQIVSECNSDDEVVQIANDNSNGQVVISGHKNAIEKAIQKVSTITENAKSDKADKIARSAKAVLLQVSGPFHSKLMEKAKIEVSEILEQVNFGIPAKPIISNVTAQAETCNFKELLLQQITGRVRWRESILFAEQHSVSQCVEIGSGKVLVGLVKRISPSIKLMGINSIESLEDFVGKYNH